MRGVGSQPATQVSCTLMKKIAFDVVLDHNHIVIINLNS